MRDMNELERQLEISLRDRKRWFESASIMKQIENMLEADKGVEGSQSLTHWIKGFAKRTGHSHTSLWSIKRAGEIYSKYMANRNGEKAMPTDMLAPLDLVYLSRLEKVDPIYAAAIADKVLAGELKGKKLRNLYAHTRSISERKKNVYAKRYTSNLFELNTRDIAKARELILLDSVSQKAWLQEFYWEGKNSEQNSLITMYRCIPDVRISTEGKRRSIDAIVVENRERGQGQNCVLHGIDFFVSDPRKQIDWDFKLNLWSTFAVATDYFWIAYMGDENRVTSLFRMTAGTNYGLLVCRHGAELRVGRDAIRNEWKKEERIALMESVIERLMQVSG